MKLKNCVHLAKLLANCVGKNNFLLIISAEYQTQFTSDTIMHIIQGELRKQDSF